jgi:integrase
MKVTSDIYQDIRRPNKHGQFYVKIRVTFNQKQKYYPTGVSLTRDDFNQVMARPKGQLKDAKIKIDQVFSKVKVCIEGIVHFSFSTFEMNYLKVNKSALDIFPFFQEIISEKERQGKVKTAIGYGTAMNSLKSFQSEIGFYDITTSFLGAYERHMASLNKSSTTVGIYLRNLRSIYNLAIREGIVNDKTAYPFGRAGYNIPQSQNIKRALSIDEIRAINNMTVFESKAEEVARDFWMLLYLCNGMNPGDLLRLRWSDKRGDEIQFIRKKTSYTTSNGLPIMILLEPAAQNLIDKLGDPKGEFIFNKLNRSMSELTKKKVIENHIKTVNKYMKRIATRVGIDNTCSTIVARHSFAQRCKDNDVPTEYISEALGHSIVKTTKNYLGSFKRDKMKRISEGLL